MIFTFIFFIEFLKERQVSWEYGMSLDMGQILSIPFILAGLFLWQGKIGKNYFTYWLCES